MLTALDHVAFVVRDLRAVTDRYASFFGCAPAWRGLDDGAEHTRFQLDNMALDLYAPDGQDPNASLEPDSTGARVRASLEKNGEGIWALGFATPDLVTTRRLLERRGVATAAPRTITSTHLIDSTTRQRTTALLAADATFGTTILLVERAPSGPAPLQSDFPRDDRSRIASLDHVVVTTAHPERAAALYGARLGLDMKLDRTNPDWGSRLMFFKCGDLIVEIAHSLKNSDPAASDKAWGVSWRAPDVAAAQARLARASFNVSDVRDGRKPGTRVFTVRDAPGQVPTLILGKQ